jgi:UDP-N-acetylmuramoyl-tripeptide--D-alanyl-D-alanine ligase
MWQRFSLACINASLFITYAAMSLIKKIIIWILGLESRLILRKYKPFIVAVTGSVGKTSTKDAIYDVFKSPGLCRDDGGICHVRKSEKSMNSEIGLPLTIIGAPNVWHSMSGWLRNIRLGAGLIFKKQEYPDCLILEVGADHPGDIRRVARWLRPDIAVITRVSRTPVHVEFFSSPEEVFKEKASLAQAVKPGGTIVLLADDEKVMSIAGMISAKDVKVISYGLSESATVRGSGEKVVYDGADSREWKVESGVLASDISLQPSTFRAPIGMAFTLGAEGKTADIVVKGILGKVYMYPLLAAAAAGMARKLDVSAVAASLSAFEPPKGRMNLIKGMNESTLIDDTYNSSPDAALAALEGLKEIDYSGTKVAVLGDMMELGKYSADEHRRIGKEAAAILGTGGRLVTVGQRSRLTAEEALKSGMSEKMLLSFDSAEEAADALSRMVNRGDVILVKGSQSMRMERVVKALMDAPAQAEKLLVRQEKEWLDKK